MLQNIGLPTVIKPRDQDSIFSESEEMFLLGLFHSYMWLKCWTTVLSFTSLFSKIFHFVVLTIPCNLSMQFKHTFLALSNNSKSLEILLKIKAHLYMDHIPCRIHSIYKGFLAWCFLGWWRVLWLFGWYQILHTATEVSCKQLAGILM